jgi:hypothetical protein
MKIKDYLFVLLVLFFFFASCNDNRNKSVFEPLSEKDAIAEMQKDSVFMLVYQEIDKNRGKLNNLSFEEKTKYYSITYSDLCDVIKSINKLSDSERDKYYKQWEAEFKNDEKKLDSISSYYKHILDHADTDLMIGQGIAFSKKHGRYPNSNEELLNDIAPDILVKYWGSFGYLYKDVAIRELVDEKYIDKFEYILFKKYPIEFKFMKQVFDK